MPEMVLLGDEALAMGAIDAGISAAYAYPGTPSSEIMEYLRIAAPRYGDFTAEWCSNEKTAYEAAVGVSLVGRRVLVSMKHVGLNVAADPFINSALLAIHGGLVLAVADRTVSIPAGEERMVGPFQAATYNDSGGLVQLTYDGVTSVTIAIIKPGS